MTEIQGWIAIVLLLLILVQLVMVGSEMRGLHKNFTIEDRRAVPKILRNRLTRRRTQSLRG
jgi:branched-subunit amino acid permease